MKKVKKITKPRYITIRIRYYPIDKEVIWGIFLSIFLFLGYISFPFLKHFQQEAPKSTVVFRQAPKVYTSPVLEGFLPKKVGTEVAKKSFGTLRASSLDEVRGNDSVILNGPRDKKQVALTFDADMTPQMKENLLTGLTESSYNKAIVDILNQTQTKATIFAAGMWIELYPEITRELAANPLFEFGNHSYSHPGFDGDCWGLVQIADDQDKEEIEKTQALLKEFAHIDNKLFRFPGGCYATSDLEIVHKEGLYVVHWDSVGNDGFNDDVSRIETNVLSSVKNGSIIVLHFNGPPNSPRTADALPNIISTLKGNGFEFVKVSELLGLHKKPQSNFQFSIYNLQ